MRSVNMNHIVGKMNIVLITLDTLRHDVAERALAEGRTPNLHKLIAGAWQQCHSPATFTYAAHQAFFAGFLPTPAKPGKHERLFAADFAGSETTSSNTYVFKEADMVRGLQAAGYQTVCIGGVGFFNKKTALGLALPSLFEESYWEEKFGVTHIESTFEQFEFAAKWMENVRKPFFMFINVSAIHQPNFHYKSGASIPNSKPPGETRADTLESHEAALAYVDSQFPILINALRKSGDTFCIVCSDHGTAYGEDGYSGHRISHPTVLTVPYTHFILDKS